MSKEYFSLENYINKYNLSEKIVIDDVEAYIEYPKYNIIYDKFWLSRSQNMICGPMGVYPDQYPIIFKPIINLYGMSRGFIKINNSKEYDTYFKDGFFWQPFFEGNQICLDIIIKDTQIIFYNALISKKGQKGSFEYHYADHKYVIPKFLLTWIKTNLQGYSGCLNFEIIGDNIIEAHLRLNGDFHFYDISFCRQLDTFFKSNFTKNIEFNYSVPKLFLFPIFLDKNELHKLNEEKLKQIQKILQKSDVVKTYYFNIINILSQGNLIRVIYFDSYDFDLGLKLKTFILNFILL